MSNSAPSQAADQENPREEDVFNRSAEQQVRQQEQREERKITAYGATGDSAQRGVRYLHAEDQVLSSQDMTIMSGKLNITGFGMRT